jgi:hypothetical protein
LPSRPGSLRKARPANGPAGGQASSARKSRVISGCAVGLPPEWVSLALWTHGTGSR